MRKTALIFALSTLLIGSLPAKADTSPSPTPSDSSSPVATPSSSPSPSTKAIPATLPTVFPAELPVESSAAQETNFYNLTLDTIGVPGATSLVVATSGKSIFLAERSTRTLYKASLVGTKLTLIRRIPVPKPITLFHKSNAIIDLLATKKNLFVLAVDGANTYPICGAAKVYEYSLTNLDAKPTLVFTSSPCVRGELFWDARLANDGNTLYIAGGNSLVDYASGIFPGPDSQDYIAGDKFPATNFFGAVSSIDLKTKKVTTIAHGLRHLGGLFFDAKTKTLWEDENGPRGGDELNIILKGKDYGWPAVTLGRSYDVESVPDGVKPNTTGNSTPPVYGWTPSISPSTMKQIPATGAFAKYWAGDLIVGSLKGHQLRRLRISKTNTVMYDEPIPVGDRIRALDVLDDGRLILTTDNGTVIIISKDSKLPTGRYPAGS